MLVSDRSGQVVVVYDESSLTLIRIRIANVGKRFRSNARRNNMSI